ncbi:unnamed protein product, partial [Allacma fusca]
PTPVCDCVCLCKQPYCYVHWTCCSSTRGVDYGCRKIMHL